MLPRSRYDSSELYTFETANAFCKTLSEQASRTLDSAYGRFLAYYAAHPETLKMPYFDAAPLPLEVQAEYKEVMRLETVGRYGLPWILFYAKVGGASFTVHVAGLDEAGLASIAGKTASEAVRALAPSAANVGEESTYLLYRSIEERQITLADETVTALCLTYQSGTECELIFVYRGQLVMVSGASDALTDELLAGLSFR